VTDGSFAAETADLDAVADVTEIQIFLAKEQEAIEQHYLGRHVAVMGSLHAGVSRANSATW